MTETTISLENLRIFAYHGYYPEERIIGQYFYVSVKVKLSNNPTQNDLNESLDYVKLAEIIQLEMRESRSLLETVLEEILQKILQVQSNIATVELEIRKPNLALKGMVVDSKVSKFYSKI